MIIKEINTSNGRIIIFFEEPTSKEPKRIFEKRVINELLNILDIKSTDFCYGSKGDPQLLIAPYNISISHSNNWFALYIGNIPIGIDIQVPKSTISSGKSFFLNEKETEWSSDIDLHLIWSAKEVIFKLLKGEMADVIMEVTVLNIDHINKKVTARFLDKTIELTFDLIDNVVLVYN